MKVFQVQDATGAIAASSCPLKLNERISVRLPWTLAESLRRQAARSGMLPSEFARNLIQLGLARRVGSAVDASKRLQAFDSGSTYRSESAR